MLNSDNEGANANKIQESTSTSLSVILSTQNDGDPLYESPTNIKAIVPKDVAYEIIVVHHSREDGTNNYQDKDKETKMTIENKKKIRQIKLVKNVEPVDIYVRGEFAAAVMKGIEQSSGQFILVMDADFPYPEEVLANLAKELITSPNSIIIASRYAKGSSMHQLPFMRSTISKGARIIVERGLKVKDVKDPLSSCFGFSRHQIKGIQIEGKGNELLLEMLVKINKNNELDDVSIKEIPFEQKDTIFLKKLDSNRIISYSKAVWHLYRYGRKSHWAADEPEIVEQKKHKSVLFLSKAGRFFTVGASGLVVNYLVSLLLSNLVLNIWYIHATFVGIIVSISSNFVLNKVWTFEDRDFSIKHFFRQYGLFLLLCSFGAALQLSLVTVFVDYYHIQYSVSLIIAVAIASIGNFLLNKKITFGEKIWE